ncbi:MAG: tetratricopeptide repeat protein [Saprospiraceae bacterium]|jgi:tetratricopeptide (TPR) repeat protein|nr:tetratricopeptide repeat protein [Saprospiraceae bacterium]
MSTYKTIISGRLEFGSERSYEQVVKQFQHRTLNYYRNDTLLDEEEIFDEISRSLSVPRLIVKEATEKSWRNTINLLKYINEYAVAGNFRIWVINEGKMVEKVLIEPESDKVAVQSFIKGRELLNEDGKEGEAVKALNRAIDKFERHALAYERRGYVNLRLGNHKDALYDFSKSIDINPNNPEPYWGRAHIKIHNGEINAAIADLELIPKRSIPHQSIYWSAKRLKGECHLKLGEFQKAVLEYKFVTKRHFLESDPNYKWRKLAFSNYGKALLEVGEYSLSINAFNEALAIEASENQKKAQAEQLLYRGMARQKAGQTGFVNDFKEAADMGSEKAAELLEEYA